MRRHVEAEALSRYREGDLSPRRAARVGAHLGACGRCSDLSRQLAGVTALLASVQPPPMPDHLAARIQGTLAAESARRVAAEPGSEPGRRDLPARRARSTPRLRMPPRPMTLRIMATAAAVVVVAGGTYAIVQSTQSGGPVGLPAAPSLGGHGGPASGTPSPGPRLGYRTRGRLASFVPVESHRNYLPATLTAQVSSALARRNLAAVGRQSTATSPKNSFNSLTAPRPTATPTQFDGITVTVLEACVTRIAAGHQVLLVELALYLSKPATLIVVSEFGGNADHLWVVGRACSATDSDVLTQRFLPSG